MNGGSRGLAGKGCVSPPPAHRCLLRMYKKKNELNGFGHLQGGNGTKNILPRLPCGPTVWRSRWLPKSSHDGVPTRIGGMNK